MIRLEPDGVTANPVELSGGGDESDSVPEVADSEDEAEIEPPELGISAGAQFPPSAPGKGGCSYVVSPDPLDDVWTLLHATAAQPSIARSIFSEK